MIRIIAIIIVVMIAVVMATDEVRIYIYERRCIDMQNEYVSELILMNQMCCMDCSSEGSGDPDCNCDGVDGE